MIKLNRKWDDDNECHFLQLSIGIGENIKRSTILACYPTNKFKEIYHKLIWHFEPYTHNRFKNLTCREAHEILIKEGIINKEFPYERIM